MDVNLQPYIGALLFGLGAIVWSFSKKNTLLYSLGGGLASLSALHSGWKLIESDANFQVIGIGGIAAYIVLSMISHSMKSQKGKVHTKKELTKSMWLAVVWTTFNCLNGSLLVSSGVPMKVNNGLIYLEAAILMGGIGLLLWRQIHFPPKKAQLIT